jgi:hypothetical protein
MAGTKRQKDSRTSNLKKKKKTQAPLDSNVRLDMSGLAGVGLAVSVYDET